jgi:uncharacterized membrane protein
VRILRPPAAATTPARPGDIPDGQARAESNAESFDLRLGEQMTTTTAPAGQQQQHRPERDPMRFHLHYQKGKGKGKDSPYAGGSSFMERVSEAVASGMGTVAFLVVSTAIILAWVLVNHLVSFLDASWHGLLNGKGFDPAPFILLNLVFSAVAFYTGALVIIAQKAQTRTDQANEEAAAKHREELNQYQTDLLQRNTDLTEQIHTLTEQLSALTEEVHAVTCRRPSSS